MPLLPTKLLQHFKFNICWSSLLLILMVSPCQADSKAASPIQILASIHPLYIAIDEAFGELVEANVLLPPQASPHHYALKPKEALQIKQADVIVWVGPEMEQFLRKSVAQRNSGLNIFTSLEFLHAHHESLLLQINEARSGSLVAETGHEHHHHDRHHSHHRAGEYDSHIWLSRKAIVAVIEGLGGILGTIQPDKSLAFQQAAAKFAETMETLDLPAPVADFTYLSYHNSFDYLARDLGLKVAGVMTTNTEVRPGATRIVEAQNQLNANASCLIVEPQFRGGIMQRLVKQTQTKSVNIDPLGGDHRRYSDFYKSVARKMLTCR